MKIASGIAALLIAVPVVQADDLAPFQIALHGGYRAGGSLEDTVTDAERDLDDASAFALSLEFRYGKGDDRYLQLWYSRQQSGLNDGTASIDVDVEYLHIGGTVPFGELGRAQPYFAAGIGATRFSASAPNAQDADRLSGSLGLGLELPLAKHAALRLEARGYLTLVDSDSSFLCRFDDGSAFCRIVATGSTIFQAEALAGIAIRF